MSYPRSQAYEHATLWVTDLVAARDFCTGVLGLVEIGTDGDATYLGCGYDASYDLALRPGGTGLEHFALRVPRAEALDAAAARLRSSGISSERLHDAEPGQEDALRFELPGGYCVELAVTGDARQPIETYRPVLHANPIAPLDADHINLLGSDVRATAETMRDVLDFRTSDITEDPGSGFCVAAWLRRGLGHHDVGIMAGAGNQKLHHIAWAYSSLDHMKLALDALAASGHRLELGVGRHPVGANLFAYLWTPGGNRFELCAEGAILDETTPTRTWSDMSETLNAWSDAPPPDSFRTGS